MKKHAMRDFWVILLLCCGVIGLTMSRAEEAGLSRAMLMVNEGKTEEAIVILRQEIDKNPQISDVHMALGVAYMEKGDYRLAKDALQKALELNPYSIAVHYSLAMLFEKERDIFKALTQWRKVLQFSQDKNLKDLAEKHVQQLEGRR